MLKVLYEAFIIINIILLKLLFIFILGEYFQGQLTWWSTSSCIFKPICQFSCISLVTLTGSSAYRNSSPQLCVFILTQSPKHQEPNVRQRPVHWAGQGADSPGQSANPDSKPPQGQKESRDAALLRFTRHWMCSKRPELRLVVSLYLPLGCSVCLAFILKQT